MSTLNTFKREDSGTNTVLSIAEFYHRSSGTPAAGLGAKIVLGSEDSANNAQEAIEIQGYLSTVTSGAEVGVGLIRVMAAGSMADALQFSVASSVVTIGSNQTTATLWNTTATTINFGGAATTVSIGSASGTATINNANTVVTGDLAVNGGDVTTSATTFNLLNATVTTGNLFGAVTTGTIGAATGTMTIRNATVRFGNASAATQIAAVNVAAGQFASFQYQTSGSFRWSLVKENTSESGSDAGSNFEIRAGTDAGALIDTPITIVRAAGGAMTLTRHLVGTASTTARATFRVPHGTAPTSPVDGDIWTTTAGMYVRINGATVGPLT